MLNNFDAIKSENTFYVPPEPTEIASNFGTNISIDHTDPKKLLTNLDSKNAMNFTEISKCILGMENVDHGYSFNTEKTAANNLLTAETDLGNGDEFVSIENIKKYLGAQNMDYIDVTLQNHLSTDYFGSFY